MTEVPYVVEVLHSLKALVITHNKLKSLDHIKRLVQLNTIGPPRPSPLACSVHR